ncbi:MAG: SPOR domain-containing protein [Acidobacteria bacterium]|nr:SPOR domain-containing protein [Acidobacteriota bacterium]
MTKEKKGGQDLVLEGRHLLGVFFLVVILCALFFTLGFVLGRSQATAQRAAAPAEKAAPPAGGPAPADLSFYDRVESKEPAEKLPPQPAESKPAESKEPPAVAAASIYLQVAAVSQEPDAKRLAVELQKLGFAPVIRPPREDRYFRVLVGPFESTELATAAQRRLEAQGFREIIRR